MQLPGNNSKENIKTELRAINIIDICLQYLHSYVTLAACASN